MSYKLHNFTTVILRKRILSYFLLSSYLLVTLHHSVTHSHFNDLTFTSTTKTSHQHDDFSEVHHQHEFHVGIFHFLGHLFEGINHSKDLSDEYLIIAQKTSIKKIIDHSKTTIFFDTGVHSLVFNIDAQSLADPPPYHLFLLHRIKQPNTPSRAPPALV